MSSDPVRSQRQAMWEAARADNLRSAQELASAEIAHARHVHRVFDELIEALAPRATISARPTAVTEVESQIALVDDELRTTRLSVEALRQHVFAVHMALTRDMGREPTGDPMRWMKDLHARIAAAQDEDRELDRRGEELRTLEAIRAGLVELRDELRPATTDPHPPA
jgi:hypothetical protein